MRLAPVALSAILAATACNTAPAATTDFFGPQIEPPRGLAKLRPGMPIAQALQLVPSLREDRRGVREHLVIDSGVADVKLEVRVDGGAVASILAVVQGHTARDLLTRAWGEPKISRDALGQTEIWWASESTGWKVELDCLERNCFVEYVPYLALTADFFGAHVVPPGPLAGLQLGMKLADARAVAPGIVDVRTGLPTGVDGVRQYVRVDDKLQAITAIYLNLPAQAKPLIEAAWGPGLDATEPVGKPVHVWHDPTTGWRAILRRALGSSFDLAFEPYLPATQLFGEQPDVLDGAPVLNLTPAEIEKLFPGQLSGGKDPVLTLLPTEWERTATKIKLDVAGGRVRQLVFSVPYKAHPAAQSTLLEMFTAKWGAPRPSDRDEGRVLIFRDGDPRVEAFDDVEHGAWRIEIRR